MSVIWKSVITFGKIANIIETILPHVSRVFYGGILKESNVDGVTLL